ncbi:MAG: hypothetical protein HY290_30685 [Planctomycetia bacterium]|nr:hypothetical protein [Planctomycetia bacterium]
MDEEQGCLHKLGLFLTALILGPFFGLLGAVAVFQPMPPVWRGISIAVVETLGVFWICLLVFIWWRPPWFRRIYLLIERRAIFVMASMLVVLILAVIIDVAIGWQRIFNMF